MFSVVETEIHCWRILRNRVNDTRHSTRPCLKTVTCSVSSIRKKKLFYGTVCPNALIITTRIQGTFVCEILSDFCILGLNPYKR